LSELGSLDNVVTCTIAGNPNIKVGDTATVTYGSYSGNAPVTSIEHDVDENGFLTTFVTGERCPRIAGWSRRVPVVYAGTSGSGIYRSMDGGIGWTDFNTGLPSGNKYVRRIAANAFDQVAAIVNGGLYLHDGLTFSLEGLPNPSNDAGDSPAPSVSELSLVATDMSFSQDQVFVLATSKRTSGSSVQDNRTWVYETDDYGDTWSSAQMFDSSGSGFHIRGIDLSGRYGTPLVSATSGSVYGLPAGEWYQGSMGRVAYGSQGCWPPDNPFYFPFPTQMGVLHYSLLSAYTTGSAPNRRLYVVMNIQGAFQPGGSLSALCTVRAIVYTLPSLHRLQDGGQIDLNTATDPVDGEAVFDSIQLSGFFIAPIAFNDDLTLEFREEVVGTTFSGRLMFESTRSNALLFERGFIRTGEPACEGQDMFVGPPMYTYADAGTMWFSFELL
jgi:hypothetical protein